MELYTFEHLVLDQAVSSGLIFVLTKEIELRIGSCDNCIIKVIFKKKVAFVVSIVGQSEQLESCTNALLLPLQYSLCQKRSLLLVVL